MVDKHFIWAMVAGLMVIATCMMSGKHESEHTKRYTTCVEHHLPEECKGR